MSDYVDHVLSKRTAAVGLSCHKALWWQLHEPDADELRAPPDVAYRLKEGARVGVLARGYVPGGTLITGSPGDAAERLEATRAAMASPDVRAVYEAAFFANDVLVYVDILERSGSAWTLIEVKSATSVSKDEHLPDIAIQGAVARAAGVRVDRYEIMHLNRACVFPDLSNLFVRADVTDLVRDRLDAVDIALAAELDVARLPEPPRVPVGDHCSKPRECPFMDRCWPVLPKHHVSTLYKMKRQARGFVAQGYETIDQLPDDAKLSVIAARQRRAVRLGEIVVERDELIKALALLERPVAHLDFETVQPAIPRWSGCHPYDQIPVQLSCHVVAADGAVTHHAWLHEGDGDPRPDAARAILAACAGATTVTAYYSPFERQCIELVAAACPDQASALLDIAGRLVDLLPIVRENVYHPDFAGSFSLKSVLPALVPHLTYEELLIKEGGTAQLELSRMLFEPETLTTEERRLLRDALLQYCQRDTEAMVALEARLLTLV